MKLLVIDAAAGGIEGTLLAASLADLLGGTAPLDPLVSAIAAHPDAGPFACSAESARVSGIATTCLRIDAGAPASAPVDGIGAAAREIAGAAGCSGAVTDLSDTVFSDLAAVAQVYALPPGYWTETVFSVLAPLLLLEAGGFLGGRIVGTPPAVPAVPAGTPPFSGPSPDILWLLSKRSVPFSSPENRPVAGSAAGIALFCRLAEEVVPRVPPLTPAGAGYGSGSGPDPAVLRVVTGERYAFIEDHVVLLETNLDDLPGEEIGYAMERLFAAGAVDVFLTPGIGKKNRPVQVLTVITSPADAHRLVALLMEETGTLGVRIRDTPRLVAEREKETLMMTFFGRTFPVRVKTSRAGGVVIGKKPEYEDLRNAAIELGVPLRKVRRLAQAQLQDAKADAGGRQAW
ncbi:MAG: LarC family nickel insertion protein [Methanomicrobiales archaeon]|nr:LarC family nickel insertion protein [Methanomicrobiales archaeon]